MTNEIFMSYTNLRKIIVRYESDSDDCASNNKNDTEYLVDDSDVDKMVTALIKLHIEPGINPHNKKSTKRIKLILLMKPQIESYWWTSSDLIGKDKSNSASVITMDSEEILFASKNIMFNQTYQSYLENASEWAGDYYYNKELEGFSKDEIDHQYNKIIENEKQNLENETKGFLHPKYKLLIKNMDYDY